MEYTPKKVFVLGGKTYLELSYAEFRQQAATYHGRRFIPLHGMLMEVSEDTYKAFYKDKRRQRYLKGRHGPCRPCHYRQFWNQVYGVLQTKVKPRDRRN